MSRVKALMIGRLVFSVAVDSFMAGHIAEHLTGMMRLASDVTGRADERRCD